MKYGDYSRKEPKFAKTRFQLNCELCKVVFWENKCKAEKKKRHYCSMKCYATDRKENWDKSEQPTWKGGVSPYEAHRKYVKNNPERIAHLKARRYARHKNAGGSHSLQEWNALKKKYKHKCAICKETKPMTKDHVVPLSLGGTDYITNIQPLCRNCNSRKWKKFNPELLK